MTVSPTWPGWETIKLIGRGSFGAVYEIQRDVLDDVEKAALKVISIPQNEGDIDEMYSDGYDDESITLTFKNHLKSIIEEYTLMRRMNGCTNIVSCEDVRYVQHDDGFGWDIFIKMELLTPLTKALPSSQQENKIIKLAKDICTALNICKKHNIIHRDIKPQNIFVSAMGDYKLGDFGIAKTVEKTMGGTKIGTYKYMAPEVYNSQPYGSAADIYSLGLVLYWLLNERRMPFLPLPPEKLIFHMEDDAWSRRMSGEAFPPPVNGSEKLKQIVMKACAFNPKDRYASAEEMLRDLEDRPIIPIAPVPDPDEIERKRKDLEETEHRRKEAELLQKAQAEQAQRQKEREERERQRKAEKLSHTYQNNTPNGSPSGEKNKLGIWIAAAAIAIVVFLFAMGSGGSKPSNPNQGQACPGKTDTVQASHQHSWKAATCTAPKTCSSCGETSGNALGHSWREATCIAPMTCTACGVTTGSNASHNWRAATCTSPKTCAICGTTSGSAADHNWIPASRTSPQTCADCGSCWGLSLGTPLTECTIVKSPKAGDMDIGNWTDFLGNSFSNAMRIWVVKKAGFYNTEKVIFDLHGECKELSGTIGCTPKKGSGASVQFRIYGDGQLLYQSDIIYDTNVPLNFSVSINGVQELVVECTTESSTHSYGLIQAEVFR